MNDTVIDGIEGVDEEEVLVDAEFIGGIFDDYKEEERVEEEGDSSGRSADHVVVYNHPLGSR